MAYDEYMADRIRQVFDNQGIGYETKKMFGGLCFMLNNKMCCGILRIKAKGTDVLMARIGPDAYDKAIQKKAVMPMDFTGRPMRGYVFVTFEGIDDDEDLEYWLNLCLAFNPLAKQSKKAFKKE
jgi:hypothetical protein